jgi:hypothetical protein
MIFDEETLNIDTTRDIGSSVTQEYCGGRVVATNDLVFVSTNHAIYALDANANIVWTHDEPGLVAIAPEGLLIVLEAGFDSIGRRFRDGTNIVVYDMN